MSKCDDIRQLYNLYYSGGAQEAYENIITTLELAIKNNECGKYFSIDASKVIATMGSIYRAFINILPALEKKFKEEGFTFKYTPASGMDDESYITISGWAD